MGGLFSSPKTVKAPPVPPPPPVLEVSEEAGELERKAVRRRRGRRKTFITGELEPVTQKKTLLG